MIYSNFNICGIYRIISPSNRIYIGQSTNIRKRLLKYKYGDIRSQPLLQKSIKKYGWKNHKVKVIKICNKDKLNKFERQLGLRYNVLSNYNLNLSLPSDGDKPYIIKEESRKKLSESRKGFIRSEISKRRQSESRKGKYIGLNCPSTYRIGDKNPNFGRTGIKHPMSRPVICIETNEEWINAKECSMKVKIPQSTLTKKLNGTCKNNTSYRYKNDRI